MLELNGNQEIALAIGALLPLLISLLKNISWSTTVKLWVSVGISVVVAFVVSAFGDKPFWTDVAYNIPIIVATAQATYAVIWSQIKPVENALANIKVL